MEILPTSEGHPEPFINLELFISISIQIPFSIPTISRFATATRNVSASLALIQSSTTFRKRGHCKKPARPIGRNQVDCHANLA